jgi:ABC-type lipoprotein release transport system permease subunit
MRRFLDVCRTGLDAALLHPLRSLVTVTALVAVLLPYLAGLAISQGVEAEAEASANFGADLYVTGSAFGRPVPLPLDAVAAIRHLDGVADAVPRIVGEVALGRERVHAVLVGLPPERFPAGSDCVEGSLPRPGGRNEFVVGTSVARHLGVKPGSTLPPFYHNERGERLCRVVGVFKPDGPLWQSHLVLTTFETAQEVFDQPGLATDVLVWCRPGPGYQAAVSRAVEETLAFAGPTGRGRVRAQVTAREDLRALLPRGLRHREGIFNLHFLLAFAVGILVVLVTSGLGLAERRREIGILKATGWQTDEVLLRGVVENFSLSLAGACLALLLAWAWLRLFNGYAVAGLFLDGAGAAPDFAVPFRLGPVPALLAFVLAFAVVLTGTLASTWRAAATPPREAMR